MLNKQGMLLSAFWHFCSHSTSAMWISVIPGVEVPFILFCVTICVCQFKSTSTVKETVTRKSQENLIGKCETLSQKRQSPLFGRFYCQCKKYGPISCLLITHGSRYGSPFHSEPVFHLLHSVVPGVQQLLGSLLSNAAEPWVVQLSHVGVVLWQHGALRPVNLLHFLEKLLWVLTR